MRPQNKSRSRNKQGNTGGQHNGPRRNTMGNIINRVFESAGPDGKVRGTPQQIIDKYQALARDAQVSGDRVAAESYLQHSEHYSRLLGEAQRQQQETRVSQERDDREEGGGGGGFDQRRPQPASQPVVASGLAMIDPEDSDDFSGPIETPESRRHRDDEISAMSGGGARREERRDDRQERREERPDDRQERREERPDDRQERRDRPERRERITQPAYQPEPAPQVQAEAPVAQADPQPAPEPFAEAPAEAAAEAAPAPAPKRRRRPRAETPAPAPVVEAE